jgi:(R,R)-butanediol dehydrogenase/meso-butanediol dehydrogenase/diacetyl reductase
MRAAVFQGPGQPLSLETVPDPDGGPGDLIIQIQRCGICGTDLHLTEHAAGYARGTIPGHEYAGEVVEVGSDVTGYAVGDLITALPSTGCGQCEACAHGNVSLCSSAPGVVGGFAEYLSVPAHTALKLRHPLSVADGALIEPLAAGRYATRRAEIPPDARVLVLGAGSIALCALYWIRRSSAARIVAMSRSARRADMALNMGADAFVLSGESEQGEVVEALEGAPDIVFECIGVPGALMQSITHVRPFGQVVSMGFCTSPDVIVPGAAAMKAITLRFPLAYSFQDFVDVADVMDAGHVDPKVLITSTVSLNDLPAAFEGLRGPNTETKVLVAPHHS